MDSSFCSALLLKCVLVKRNQTQPYPRSQNQVFMQSSLLQFLVIFHFIKKSSTPLTDDNSNFSSHFDQHCDHGKTPTIGKGRKTHKSISKATWSDRESRRRSKHRNDGVPQQQIGCIERQEIEGEEQDRHQGHHRNNGVLQQQVGSIERQEIEGEEQDRHQGHRRTRKSSTQPFCPGRSSCAGFP